MAQGTQKPAKGSFGGAIGASLIVALLLGWWLPIVGPFFAGFSAGRQARSPLLAFVAALAPAALLGGVLWFAARFSIPYKHDVISLGPLEFVAPAAAGIVLAGALCGASGGGATVLGVVALLASFGWLGFKGLEYWRLARHMMAGPATVQKTSAQMDCVERLKKLHGAMIQYAGAWDDTLPPADRWEVALTDETQRFIPDEGLACPGAAPHGYAMNDAVAGKRLRDITDKAGAVLLFDTSAPGPNAHGDLGAQPNPGRHAGANNRVYLDGRVEEVAVH